jgi:hypothetical protein
MNIFFFVKTSKVNGKYLDKYIEDYLRNKKVNIISTLEGLKKVKELDWVYYNQGLITSPDYKKYEKILERIKINTFCFVNYKKPNIFDKNYLHKTLKKYEKPEIFRKYFMDQIEIKDKSDIDNFMRKDKIYIVKPIPGSGGMGIKVFNDPKKLYNYISNYRITKNISEKKKIPTTKIKTWVLQEYIDNPLLLNGKKFHIRAAAFIYLKNNIKKFYLFNKYFIYIAVKKFVLNNFNNIEIHNTHGAKLTKNDVVNATRDFYKMPEKILRVINEKIIQICKIIKKYIRFNCYDNNKECFSYIGFDFMVNNNYEVKCIEINQRPGLSRFQVSEYIEDFFQGMVDITLYKENSAKNYTEIIDDEKKSIFFYEPEFKNIKELLPKNYEIITLDELKNKKYIDWVYWSTLLSKKYKNILYNIDSDYRNHLNYTIPGITYDNLFKRINKLKEKYEKHNNDLLKFNKKKNFDNIKNKYEFTGHFLQKVLYDKGIDLKSNNKLNFFEIFNCFNKKLINKNNNFLYLGKNSVSFKKSLNFYLKENSNKQNVNFISKNTNNINEEIIKKSKTLCKDIDLLIIDIIENNNNLFQNISYILNNLPIKGNCIIKLSFQIDNKLNIYLLSLCNEYFKSINFYKSSINYLNDEYYLICLKKKEIKKIIKIEDKKLLDLNFLYQFFSFMEIMINQRDKQIKNIINLYEKDNSLTNKEKEKNLEKKLMKVIKWMQQNNVISIINSNKKSNEIVNNFTFNNNFIKDKLIFRKDILHKLVREDNPKFFKKYFMNQITIEKESNINKFIKNNKIYIVKPIPGSGGFGVKIFKNSKKIKNYIGAKEFSNKEKIKFQKDKIEKWVIQEYIDNPLLIDAKKFHIRVMLLNLNKLNHKYYYLYDNYLIYPATKKYNKNTLNMNIHNSHGSGFSKEELMYYYKEYNKIDIKIREHIKKQIIEVCCYLKKFFNYYCFNETKNCYQYIGLDIMVTNKYEVKCIEINERPGTHGPSMFNSFFKGLLDITILNKDFTQDYTEL